MRAEPYVAITNLRCRSNFPCNRSGVESVIIHNIMKLKLITFAAIGAFSLGSTAVAQEPQGGQGERGGRGGGGRGARGASIERITDQLNLTPDQKAKAQPIIDQARPQIENIRREAMQKMKAVMDNAVAQIRQILTPEQQKTLDEV